MAHRFQATDRDTVIKMVAQGCGRKEIAKALKISVPTLRRHFNDVLNHKSGSTPKVFAKSEIKMIKKLARVGTSDTEIAQLVGVSAATLKTQMGEVLANSRIEANGAVLNSLYDKAVAQSDVQAMKYWANNRIPGWGDKLVIDGNLKFEGSFELSMAERAQAMRGPMDMAANVYSQRGLEANDLCIEEWAAATAFAEGVGMTFEDFSDRCGELRRYPLGRAERPSLEHDPVFAYWCKAPEPIWVESVRDFFRQREEPEAKRLKFEALRRGEITELHPEDLEDRPLLVERRVGERNFYDDYPARQEALQANSRAADLAYQKEQGGADPEPDS